LRSWDFAFHHQRVCCLNPTTSVKESYVSRNVSIGVLGLVCIREVQLLNYKNLLIMESLRLLYAEGLLSGKQKKIAIEMPVTKVISFIPST
jgi:hypothetical protein